MDAAVIVRARLIYGRYLQLETYDVTTHAEYFTGTGNITTGNFTSAYYLGSTDCMEMRNNQIIVKHSQLDIVIFGHSGENFKYGESQISLTSISCRLAWSK